MPFPSPLSALLRELEALRLSKEIGNLTERETARLAELENLVRNERAKEKAKAAGKSEK